MGLERVAVRDAEESDLPDILAITNEVIATTDAIWTETPQTLEERAAWFRQRRARGFPVLVAVDASGVAGFASYGPFRDYPGFRLTVEHTVHVRADRRNAGGGRALVSALIARAEAAGVHVMVGAIDAGNASSIHLHRSLGFQEVGRMPQTGIRFGRWLNLVLLQRILGEDPLD